MAPHTIYTSPPNTSEHVCQAAEMGRWSLVSEAVLERSPDNSIIAVPKDESRLITAALQQHVWDFLQAYVSRGFCQSLLTFETVLLRLVTEQDKFPFTIDTILGFRSRYVYRWRWLIDVLDRCLEDGRHLSRAAQLVPLLPLDTPAAYVTERLVKVEGLQTTDVAQKEQMVEAFKERAITISAQENADFWDS